jgi:hypothetical protein
VRLSEEITVMKTTMKMRYKESGMAVLSLVLMLAMVGAVILPALLGLMSTASKAGQVEERKTGEFYSADAGINAALWRIKTDGKLDWLNSDNGKWEEDVYGHSPAYETYTLPLAPNGNSVVYTIAPKWVLENLETPNATQQRTPAENVKVYGSYNGTGTNGRGSYKILVYYDGNAGGLGINRIGCWLPPGFEYVLGSSNLETTQNLPGRPYCEPTVTPFRGGHSVIWEYSNPVDFNLFEPPGTQKELTFEFTPNQVCRGEFSWLSDNDTAGINYLAWSALNVFEVRSTATSPSGESTTAISYSIREVGDSFGSAIEGDYYAFGRTLMRDSVNSDQQYRDRLYQESTYTVTAIPSNAQVEKVLLYWTGWKCKPWTSSDPAGKKVDSVACRILVNGVTFSENITSTQTQSQIISSSGSPHGWSYSCFADITERVKDFFSSHGGGYIGNGGYTVGHTDFVAGSKPSTGEPWYALYNYNSGDNSPPFSGESVVGYTRYPLGSPRNGGSRDNIASPYYEDYPSTGKDEWAYAAWSVIIVYSSPATLGHQLYRFDEFYYCDSAHPLTKVISGFVVPDLVNETDAAKLTCFVGEGDDRYNSDTIKMNGTTLPEGSPSTDIWNSRCYPSGDVGIDIDTFPLSATVIGPEGTNTATVLLQTGTDCWNLVYMILSFRSKLSAGDVFMYELQ